ncbi:MAG: T9SS type A sorting domain-containing protein [Syntrophomonadaceae bacterium]
MKNKIVKFAFAAALMLSSAATAQTKTESAAAGTLQSAAETLTGKIMCGYQGWFAVPSDAINRGWYHYTQTGTFAPGSCKIDLWPDVSEFDDDEKYVTSFKKADGNPAMVFSSQNRKTVVRHFKWMKDYNIDGVFIQRFITEVKSTSASGYTQWNNVLASCRVGANQYGRTFAIMYDLSGLQAGQMSYVINDWKMLVDSKMVTKDSSYQFHNGKPVVAVWGIGFNDGRKYSLQECSTLIDFLKNDPKYGGNTVMVGVPTYWRTLTQDCLNDSLVHKIILKADIVSPWFVGRYNSPQAVAEFSQNVTVPDIAWCKKNGKEYLPVAFPGFSWHNMKPESPSNAIPRLKGQFLWKQYYEDIKAGATMIYQAMFDEIDEGTAIFKCTNDVPVGASTFVTYEGLETDFYLWLTGQGKRMLNKEISLSDAIPDRYPGFLKFTTNNSSGELNYIVPGFTGTLYSDQRHADMNQVLAYKFPKDKLVQLSNGSTNLLLSLEVSNEFVVSVSSSLQGEKTPLFRWNAQDVHIHDESNKQVLQVKTKTYFDQGWDTIYVFIEDGIKSDAPGASIYSVKISDAGTSDLKGFNLNVPEKFELYQNFPNPFNPTTTINYTIPDSYDVDLSVYNIMGQKIKTLVSAYMNAGSYHASWDGKNSLGSDAPSGIYFYSLHYKDIMKSRKMLLLR